jgi:hypothetical protein
MIQNEAEYRHSQEMLLKMYSLRDRFAAEALWDLEGRRDAVAGVESQIRKIEREVAEYLTRRLSAEAVEKEPARAA